MKKTIIAFVLAFASVAQAEMPIYENRWGWTGAGNADAVYAAVPGNIVDNQADDILQVWFDPGQLCRPILTHSVLAKSVPTDKRGKRGDATDMVIRVDINRVHKMKATVLGEGGDWRVWLGLQTAVVMSELRNGNRVVIHYVDWSSGTYSYSLANSAAAIAGAEKACLALMD